MQLIAPSPEAHTHDVWRNKEHSSDKNTVRRSHLAEPVAPLAVSHCQAKLSPGKIERRNPAAHTNLLTTLALALLAKRLFTLSE